MPSGNIEKMDYRELLEKKDEKGPEPGEQIVLEHKKDKSLGVVGSWWSRADSKSKAEVIALVIILLVAVGLFGGFFYRRFTERAGAEEFYAPPAVDNWENSQ